MFLCYSESAKMNYIGWENEALPLGNGKIGAKIFGGTDCELISFNEKTLWSGGKDSKGFNNYGISNADDGKALREIEALLKNGDTKKATETMKKLEGNFGGFGAYQAFGNLYLSFSDKGKSEKYIRDLDLDTASAMVTYAISKKTFTRHYFVSYPDNVFVGRIEAEGEENNTFDIDAYFVSEQKGVSVAENGSIFVSGTVNANEGLEAEDGEYKNNMKYGCEIRFIPKDGEITEDKNGHINIKNTSSVVIIASFATDYVNDFPVFSDGSDPQKKASAFVENASKKTFGELYRAHLADYKALFDRVKFTLGEDEAQLTTDYMLKRFEKTSSEYKRNLITTLFAYGRYLLIASSREGSLPANLQGIWNAKNNPPWQSDYHFNINIQMNYWPAYVTNLAETALPYIDFINSLKKPGRLVAKETMGIGERKADGTADYEKPTGFVIHTMVNPLGHVAPGFSWRWGWAPVNGAWAIQGMYDYYLFTKDTEKLKKDIYPAMEETALLWSQLLSYDEKSERLVVSPCFSPEHGPVSSGGTYEQSIIYGLFESYINASRALINEGFMECVNNSLLEKIEKQLPLLKPYSIGKNKMIKEWFDEDKWGLIKKKNLGIQNHHRHISHLLGLYPYTQITEKDKALMEAAENSLKDRGIKTTGWALSHRLLAYARLKNGNMCDEIIKQTIKTMILKNLFGSHPPFQIDCNFGFTAGVSEMLLQSDENRISLLPALPDSWKEGSFSGLMARGNFELSATWKDGKLKEGSVKSNLGGKCKLYYDGKVMLVYDENGNEIETEFSDGTTSFNAEKGKVYKLS